MRYAVRAGERDLELDATPDGRFLIGGAVVAAEVVEAVRRRVYSVIVGGQTHEVAWLGDGRVWVDGDEVRLSIVDERAAVAVGAGPSAGSAREEIRAPMPGLLKRLHVSEGDVVAAGDALITLEAMKMENELRAPQAGTVTKLGAGVGATVDGGTLLVVIAPDRTD